MRAHQTNDNSRAVFNNARALLIIQVANQLLPLVLIPYLARTLGAATYGVVSYGLSIVAIAGILTDYGFNLSATLQISKAREDVVQVNKLVGAIFSCKVLLSLIASGAVIIYALTTSKYAEHEYFLLLLVIPIIAQAFQPVWFFQGIEKMGYIAWFTLASRLLYVAFVFKFVTQASDYYILAIVNGVSQLMALGLSLIFMFKENYWPRWPGFAQCIDTIKASTPFFWSRAAVSTYTAGGALFLGLYGNSLQVAYYAAAEQLYKGGQSLFAPLAQALYPNLARTHNFKLLFRILKATLLICVLGMLFGIFAGEWLIALLFGNTFNGSYVVLLVFLVTLTVNTPSVLLGYPLLGALGQAGKANKSVMIAGALQLVLLGVCLALRWAQAFEIALTVLIVETLVLGLRVKWGSEQYQSWSAKRQVS
jgi:PST family polysaccharide transporter